MQAEVTPLVDQYNSLKAQYKDYILLFRLGDFYEAFNDDAKTVSRVLGLTLTRRFRDEKEMPMAGVPHHSASTYITRLLNAGLSVAVAEQMEDPEEARKQGKKIVERKVVRVITPGTRIEEGMPDAAYVYVAAVARIDEKYGIAWAELASGRFFAATVDNQTALADELVKISPAELILSNALAEDEGIKFVTSTLGIKCTPRNDWEFTTHRGRKILCELFKVASLEAYSIEPLPEALAAAGGLASYLKETQFGNLHHIGGIRVIDRSRVMCLDSATVSALEVVSGTGDSLFDVLNRCRTPMGARLLKDWLLHPLTDAAEIALRQDAVHALVQYSTARKNLASALAEVGDLERLAGRIGTLRATPQDLLSLSAWLKHAARIQQALAAEQAILFSTIAKQIDDNSEVVKLLDCAISTDPERTIKIGYNAEIDLLYSIKTNSDSTLRQIEDRERKRTGIGNLKIGFNSVFGYYIEVSNSHKNKVPKDFVRKQTLTNGERFITTELKDLETQILNAEKSVAKMEQEVFSEVRAKVCDKIQSIIQTAQALAVADCIDSFAEIAVQRNYVRPEIAGDSELMLIASRHPVVEANPQMRFIPNDCQMADKRRIHLITGPNMAGKSTYIRQVGICVLLAQAGSFVPAERAKIGVVDRIFARVGASDRLSKGQSTFMVEMIETAHIMQNATARSLIILDEIGRGTSTYDGISISWAVVEYLHDHIGARTLFATHYHELIALEDLLPDVTNLHAEVRETKGSVVFLYKILEGPSDRSYGIHVAALAGLPKEIVTRSKKLLREFERTLAKVDASGSDVSLAVQESLFELAPKADEHSNQILHEIETLDLNHLSPLQALQKLAELQERLKKK